MLKMLNLRSYLFLFNICSDFFFFFFSLPIFYFMLLVYYLVVIEAIFCY